MEPEEIGYCDWCNKPFEKKQLKPGILKINGKNRIYKFCPNCYGMIKDKTQNFEH